ncbi:energy transducer TonB [Pontibacter virosus]|uniref:TonB family protein n=1 Tax=Pontibacter virosus TaxID=1765052 RepID=A0A2U1AVR2_9BACT|nr:energy transducer TonB [Pontibacter virosus]PVY40498.1 TonB family protein [Pontibacter virosus]
MKHIYSFLLAVTLFCIGHYAQAQYPEISTKYVNENGKEVSPDQAAYFIVSKKDSLGRGTRTKFQSGTNKKLSLTIYSNIDGGKYGYGTQHGPSMEWYENGQLKTEAYYLNNELTGNFNTWYESGQKELSRKFHNGTPTDTLTSYYETGVIRRQEVYADGNMQTGKVYDETGKEQAYFPMQVMPEFPGGEKRMLQWLGSYIRYPKTTRKAKAEGIVFVVFVIDKEGNINNPEVIKGFHVDADAEALRVVRGMPTWKPGLLEGKPTPVRYTLPVRFALH